MYVILLNVAAYHGYCESNGFETSCVIIPLIVLFFLCSAFAPHPARKKFCKDSMYTTCSKYAVLFFPVKYTAADDPYFVRTWRFPTLSQINPQAPLLVMSFR